MAIVSKVPEHLIRQPASPTVPGYGNRTASIFIIGEAPAETEVKLGRPFMGKAGQQLDELLKEAGIHRDDVYCTNASLRPIRGEKDKHFFANKKKGIPSDNLLEGMKAIGNDLAEINPNVVVPLGNYALWTMMQHQSIMNWRGSILWSDLWKRKVVPTIHPAALLRNSGEPGGTEDSGGMWKMRSVVIWDLIRALDQSKFPDLRRTPRTLIVNPTGELHDECVARLMNAKEMGTDIESWGGTNLACVGFSDGDPTWAVTWSNDGPERMALFKALLETPIPKYGQNLQYDATMLDQNGIFMRNVVYDTMVASHILYPEFPKGLDFQCSIYSDIPYYKDEGKNWKQSTDPKKRQIFYEYNAKDLCATTESKLHQSQEMTERKLWDAFNRKMQIFDACREGTFYGMRGNIDLLHQFIKETQAERDAAQEELNKVAGYSVNPRSPNQVKKLIYEDRRLPERRKHGKVTTDQKALMDLVAKTGDRALSLVIIVRKKSKLLGNYYNDKIVSADGRIRYGFNLVGTKFGRLSSSAPLWGPGLNGQNIPHSARRIFIADDDSHELAEFDQVQAEAVITAYLADDPVHIDCFRYGKDVHRVTAALMLDMDPNKWKEIPKDSMIRQLAKKCNHGLNYGMQWATFMAIVNSEYDPEDPNSLHLTAAEAKRIHAKYLSIRPALHNYWDGIKRELRDNRTLVSPLGLPHTFLDQWSDTMLREGFSFKPQSCVGELTNIAIDRVYHDDEMRRMGVRFVTQVHDSIVFQWPKDNRKDIMSRMWPLLETEVYLNGYRVVVPWEGNAGPTWYKGDMEPLGLSRVCCEVGFD